MVILNPLSAFIRLSTFIIFQVLRLDVQRVVGQTVVLTEEAYTTKKVLLLFGRLDVNFGPSPHRYVHCPVCRRGANRDRNGVANILLKATGR
jgi:transposase